MNQYQAILVGGAALLSLVAGAAWPLVILAGLELLALPLVVGNERLGNALAARRRTAEGLEPAKRSLEGLTPASRRRYDSLSALADAVQRNYARTSDVTRPLLEEQRAKLEAVLDSAVSHLRALEAIEELGRTGAEAADVDREIAALEGRLASEATSPNVREKLSETLAYKRRLKEALARSAERREAIRAEMETLETALQILAQESAGLLAPSEVAARLDDLVRDAETTGDTVRELERFVEEARTAEIRRGAAVAAGG